MSSVEACSDIALEPREKPGRLRCALRFMSAPRRGEPSFWDDSNASATARAISVLALLTVVSAVVFALSPAKAPPEPAKAGPRAQAERPAAAAPASLTLLVSVDPNDDFPLDSDFNSDAAAMLYRRLAGKPLIVERPGHILFGAAQQVRASIVERVVSAAKTAGADPALMMSIADKESNFSPSVKASTSSASGLFQFIDTTWLRVVREFGERYGHAEEAKAITGDDEKPAVSQKKRAEVLGLRNDPYLAAAMAAEMLKRDGQKIADMLGRPLSAGETYLLHFLGPDDATRFMSKLDSSPDASAAKLLPKPARANKPIFFARQNGKLKERSIKEVHEAFEHMMGDRLERFADVEQRLPDDARAYAAP
ncbi:MAG TPA: transglycosylase SLT domain-containing protein [Methylocystis sp.]|nr:transglycosylase SLT domain-containing protein [Methylocystis sp.]